jgi:hypothetical protein
VFKVMKERCAECLYGSDKIVSNARRAEIIRKVRRTDSYFVCHKASIAGQAVCCKGDFDAGGGGQLGRIMGRLNGIVFIDESSLKNVDRTTSVQKVEPS